MTQRLYKDDGTPVNSLADDDGRQKIATDEGVPLHIVSPDGSPVGGVGANGTARSDDLTSVAITASSQSQALPVPNGTYVVQAWGDVAYIATGAASGPTVSIAAGGFSLVVADGATVGPIKLNGSYISWIGTTTGGFLTFCPVEG